MRVKIVRSPDPKKKFRAILESGKTVDFGARGYSDYETQNTFPHAIVCITSRWSNTPAYYSRKRS